jgi:hypothetical protein
MINRIVDPQIKEQQKKICPLPENHSSKNELVDSMIFLPNSILSERNVINIFFFSVITIFYLL